MQQANGPTERIEDFAVNSHWTAKLEVCVFVVIMCTIRRQLYHSTVVFAVDGESLHSTIVGFLASSIIFSIVQTSDVSCGFFSWSFYAFTFYFLGFV